MQAQHVDAAAAEATACVGMARNPRAAPRGWAGSTGGRVVVDVDPVAISSMSTSTSALREPAGRPARLGGDEH
jgi:hypothetical protein